MLNEVLPCATRRARRVRSASDEVVGLRVGRFATLVASLAAAFEYGDREHGRSPLAPAASSWSLQGSHDAAEWSSQETVEQLGAIGGGA